jgi:hypothetical protein
MGSTGNITESLKLINNRKITQKVAYHTSSPYSTLKDRYHFSASWGAWSRREHMVEAAFIVPLFPVPQTGWRLLDHYAASYLTTSLNWGYHAL